jgi:hypothetical protein
MPPPKSTGDNGLMGYVEAPVAGALGTAANVVQSGQAAAKLVGADTIANTAADWAQRLRGTAAGFQSPELEQNAQDHPWSPSNIGYQVLKGAPGALATLGAAVVAPEAVGPAVGAGIASLPQMIGGNVETSEDSNGPLTRGQAAKAIALGVPEAALGAWSGGRAAATLAGGIVAKSAARAAASQAFVGGVTGAGQDIIAQQMNNRSIPFRMDEMITSALTGGATGVVMGGGLHALAKVAPTEQGAPNADIAAGVDAALGRGPSTEGGAQLPLPLEQPNNPNRPYQATPQARLDQLSAHFKGLEQPNMFEQQLAGHVENEQALRAAAPQPQTRGEPVLAGQAAPIDTGTPQPSPDLVDLAMAHVNNVAPDERNLSQPIGRAPTEADLTTPHAAEPVVAGREGVPQPRPEDVALINAHAANAAPEQVQGLHDLTPLPTAEDFEGRGPEPAVAAKDLTQAIGKKLYDQLDHTNKDTQRASFLNKLPDAAKNGDALLSNAQLRGTKALDIPTDKGKIIPETAENAIPRDAFDTKAEKANWDAAQELRPAVAGDKALTEVLDKVQTNPGAADVPEVLAKVKEAATVSTARADVTGEPPAPQPVAPAKPVDGTPSPEAVAKAPTDPVQQSLSRLRAMTDVAKPGVTPKRAANLNELWQVGLQHDPTGTALWDDHLDKFSPEAQAALEAHGNLVADATAKGLYGPRAAPAPTTQTGVDLEHIANNGGTLKHQLDYLQTNGENGTVKTVSRLLSRNGVDANVVVSDQGLPFDRGAMYDPKTNTITVRPGEATGQLLAHEAVHAASAKALEAGGQAAQDMNKLYEAVKAKTPDGDAYGLQNVHEFLAEAHSNPDFRETLRSMPADPSMPGKPTSMWQAFKNIVARLVGAPAGGQRTMLDQVMETSNRVMTENRAAPASPSDPLYGPIDKLKQMFGASDQAKEAVASRAASTGVAGQKAVLGMRSPSEIVAGVAKQVPSAARWFNAVETESNQKNAWNKSRAVAHNAYMALTGAERAGHDAAAAATYFGIDPRKPPAQMNPELMRQPNAPELLRAANDAYRTYNGLSPAAKAAFQMRVDTNQASKAASFAMALDRTMKFLHPELTAGFENNPARDYQMSKAGMEAHDAPALSKKFWTDEIDKRMATVSAAANAEKVMAPGGDMTKASQAARDKVESLERWVDGADALKKSFDGVPYFRAGRGNGNFFAAGTIAPDETGLPKAAAVAAINARLEKDGFGDSIIDRANGNNKMYIKTDSLDKVQRLEAAFRDLQKQGHLSADDPVSSGSAEQAVHHGVAPKFMQDVISTIEANKPTLPDDMDPTAKAEFMAAWNKSAQDMTRDLMDMLSDSSPTKINAERKDVQGMAMDVGRQARDTDANVSAMLARQGTADDKGAAISGMRDDMRSLNENEAVTPADRKTAQDAVTELMNRETRRPTTKPNGLVNALTWITRASEIGFNPAYFVTLHAQDWTYSWGELGKTHGMAASARELAKAELPSIKVMRAMTKDPDWSFAGMRKSTLEKGGVSEKDAEYLTALDNMGAMTHGALTQSMFSEEGEGLRAKIANMSTAMGRYAEVQPRIKLALAARALWRGEAKDGPLLDFAAKKIKGAQFDYSAENAPRQLTRSGMFGDFSPLINQFMSYRTKATEKLIREFHQMFAGETAQDKVEAGKFLAAHLAATTVLAGAMGMPMAAVFASVYDKMADELTGSPTHDIMGSFRHYLALTYGKTAGIAMARGIPAALGVDLSHLGDQKIAPGSDLLMMWSEKRKFEDAEKDWLKNLAGSSVGLAMNWGLGARDMANGDYVNGAVKMAPEALKGPIEALRDKLYGYRDKGGTPLGITPRGIDLALEAMGFDPTKVATMQMNKNVLSGLEARRQYQSQNITQHLAKAEQLHDPAAMKYWEQQSTDYQHEWPGMKPPIADLGRYLDTHLREAAEAKALGAPMGIRPNNVTERKFFSGGMLQP